MTTGKALPRTLALLAVAAAALAGWRLVDRRQPGPSGAAGRTVPLALGLKPESVRRLTLESGDRRVELDQNPTGVWTPGDGTASETPALMSTVEDDLFPLPAYRKLSIDTARPEYGLSRPELKVTVEDVTDRRYRLSVGAWTFTQGGSYVLAEGEGSGIYLVPRHSVDDLRSLLLGRHYESPRPARELQTERDEQSEADELKRRKSGDPLPPLETPWLRQAMEYGPASEPGRAP